MALLPGVSRPHYHQNTGSWETGALEEAGQPMMPQGTWPNPLTLHLSQTEAVDCCSRDAVICTHGLLRSININNDAQHLNFMLHESP